MVEKVGHLKSFDHHRSLERQELSHRSASAPARSQPHEIDPMNLQEQDNKTVVILSPVWISWVSSPLGRGIIKRKADHAR
jgi:hypothetical protein